jgi:hypothetical protein
MPERVVLLPVRGIYSTPFTRPIVDPDMCEYLSHFDWRMKRNGRVVARNAEYGDELCQQVLLHRVVLGLPQGVGSVHHKNGKPLDCRRSNLQFFQTLEEHTEWHQQNPIVHEDEELEEVA